MEGFGGRARRVPRSLTCGMCCVPGMYYDSSSPQLHIGAAAVLSYHVAVRTSQEGRECNKQQHSRWFPWFIYLRYYYISRPRKNSTRSSTCRVVNEARRLYTSSWPCAFEKHEIPPHPKHTTKSTAARRPRPPRDGVRRNTSHALAHTRPLP